MTCTKGWVAPHPTSFILAFATLKGGLHPPNPNTHHHRYHQCPMYQQPIGSTRTGLTVAAAAGNGSGPVPASAAPAAAVLAQSCRAVLRPVP